MALAKNRNDLRYARATHKPVTEKSILSFLGLAERAGKVISGAQAVEDSVIRGKAFLVIVACDSSDSTISKMTGISESYKVRMIRFSTKYNIGHHIGKPDRAVAAIDDKGFADRLSILLSEYQNQTEQDANNSIDEHIEEKLGGIHDRK